MEFVLSFLDIADNELDAVNVRTAAAVGDIESSRNSSSHTAAGVDNYE